MSDYPYEETAAAEPDVDPRVVAVQRVVDLERQHEMKAHDAERRTKEAAIIGEELRQARDELRGLLGYPSNANKVQAMDGATARKLAADYR